ncbi:hypothetical protein ACLKA7_004347 [Drosophila subpalustris]
MMVKMTEEILAVKLEARKHRQDSTSFEVLDSKHLPLSTKEALEEFEKTIEENEEKLHKFKEFIGKIGGDGAAQFLRAAIRKVFADDLAVTYSWKGTATKPSAERLFVVTTIKISATAPSANCELQHVGNWDTGAESERELVSLPQHTR